MHLSSCPLSIYFRQDTLAILDGQERHAPMLGLFGAIVNTTSPIAWHANSTVYGVQSTGAYLAVIFHSYAHESQSEFTLQYSVGKLLILHDLTKIVLCCV